MSAIVDMAVLTRCKLRDRQSKSRIRWQHQTNDTHIIATNRDAISSGAIIGCSIAGAFIFVLVLLLFRIIRRRRHRVGSAQTSVVKSEPVDKPPSDTSGDDASVSRLFGPPETFSEQTSTMSDHASLPAIPLLSCQTTPITEPSSAISRSTIASRPNSDNITEGGKTLVADRTTLAPGESLEKRLLLAALGLRTSFSLNPAVGR